MVGRGRGSFDQSARKLNASPGGTRRRGPFGSLSLPRLTGALLLQSWSPRKICWRHITRRHALPSKLNAVRTAGRVTRSVQAAAASQDNANQLAAVEAKRSAEYARVIDGSILSTWITCRVIVNCYLHDQRRSGLVGPCP